MPPIPPHQQNKKKETKSRKNLRFYLLTSIKVRNCSFDIAMSVHLSGKELRKGSRESMNKNKAI